jgi:16S rRNA (cytosine967-C5)-methyltransferase
VERRLPNRRSNAAPNPSSALPGEFHSQKLVLSVASEVIRKADREHPADAVLRHELMAQRRFPQDLKAEVSRVVFIYYRWRGWLDPGRPLARQIEHALELADAFAARPQTFSEEKLIDRAVPAWVRDVLDVRGDWVRAIQSGPKLWLRAKRGQGRTLATKLGTTATPAPMTMGDAVLYEGKEDLFRRAEFHAGEFEMQDIVSQAVGWLCDPKPGETWWDVCAGEGGKMLHLSDLMENKGLIWASDRAEWRLRNLKRRAARAQAFNYRLALWDGGEKLPTRTPFDGVLVDAPCSGIGTWQRNPHARWTTTREDVSELAEVQVKLLSRVAGSVKSGGKLIYAVCTLAVKETVSVAEAFGAASNEFAPEPLANPFRSIEPASPQLTFWPQDTEGSGMFVAAWRRR